MNIDVQIEELYYLVFCIYRTPAWLHTTLSFNYLPQDGRNNNLTAI